MESAAENSGVSRIAGHELRWCRCYCKCMLTGGKSHHGVVAAPQVTAYYSEVNYTCKPADMLGVFFFFNFTKVVFVESIL